MITIRHADTMGVARSGGQMLRSHFSFADYHDPLWNNEGRLRAVNEGDLSAGEAYHIGPEAAVDIVTWLRSGTVTTAASGFPSQKIVGGGLHVISAGTGCAALQWTAGEQGASFVQFWFLSDVTGTAPAQETRPSFAATEDGGFRIVASGFPEDDPEDETIFPDGAPVALSASARLLHAAIPAGEGAVYRTASDRDLYLLLVSGSASIGEMALRTGDAVAITGEASLTIVTQEGAVVLLADVAA